MNHAKKLWALTAAAAAAVMLAAAVLCLVPWHRHSYGEEVPLGKVERGYVFVKTCGECGKEARVYYEAMVTFVDDDGRMQALRWWESIMEATGIRMTAALISGEVQETTDYDVWWAHAGWDQIRQLQEKGMDFVDHTYSHTDLTALTEEELRQELQRGKDELEAHGIYSDILIYPTSTYSNQMVSVVDDYFSAAFYGKDMSKQGAESAEYARSRVNINNTNRKVPITFENGKTVDSYGVKTLQTLKEELIVTLEDKGWLVYMTHAYDSPGGKHYFDEAAQQTIIGFCRYVQSLDGIKIATLTEGLAASVALPE